MELEKNKFRYVGREACISTDFDNGSLARVEEKKTNIFDVWPWSRGWLPDSNFCFHFRLDGCKGKEIELRFHIKEREKEGDASIVYANPDFPVYSYDGEAWMRMENKSLSHESLIEGGQTISVRQTYTEDTAYIAYQYPYSNSRLEACIQRVSDSPFCKVEIAGKSTDGRLIKQICVTDFDIPIKEKKIAWFTGLQHPAELGAGWGLEGMIDYLLSDDPTAEKAREDLVFKLIPIVNVDSVAEGRGKIHSSGRNLNREWERPDPVPEIAAIKRTLNKWQAEGNNIDIFIDFHGFSAKEDENWCLVLLPEENLNSEKEKIRYRNLVEAIKKFIPQATCVTTPSIGYAAGAALRQYGALSMSVDGYVYKWPGKGVVPDLSSHYDLGNEVWSLEGIRSCGAEFIKALVKFHEACYLLGNR